MWNPAHQGILNIATPRALRWTNGQHYPMIMESADDARNYVALDGRHDFDGSDIMDDAIGAWPQGSSAPMFIGSRIQSNKDMRVALGEAWLDRNGLNSLNETQGAVEQMLLKNPHLLREFSDKLMSANSGDVLGDILLKGLSSSTDWPWFNPVYEAGAKDLGRVTHMNDWNAAEATEVLNRYARWQVAREMKLKRR